MNDPQFSKHTEDHNEPKWFKLCAPPSFVNEEGQNICQNCFYPSAWLHLRFKFAFGNVSSLPNGTNM